MRHLTTILALFILSGTTVVAGLSLGEAGGYAVLGLNGAVVVVDSNGAKITGNVGIASGGQLNFTKGTINGDIYLDPRAGCDIKSQANHTGEIFDDWDMSQAVADAGSVSAYAAGLAATHSVSSITESWTIPRTGRLNVLHLTTLDLFNKEVLTLEGPAR